MYKYIQTRRRPHLKMPLKLMSYRFETVIRNVIVPTAGDLRATETRHLLTTRLWRAFRVVFAPP